MSLWGAAGVGTRGRRQSELREEVPLRLLRRTALTRIVDEQQGMEPKVTLDLMVSPDSRSTHKSPFWSFRSRLLLDIYIID